jgi:hypothetical protein
MSLRLLRYEYDDPYMGRRYGSIAADRVVFEDTISGKVVTVPRNKDSNEVRHEDLPPLLQLYGENPLVMARDFDPQDLVGR